MRECVRMYSWMCLTVCIDAGFGVCLDVDLDVCLDVWRYVRMCSWVNVRIHMGFNVCMFSPKSWNNSILVYSNLATLNYMIY